ncbi:hypothetical protein GI584_22725 [Gracilibacillus salitolerans]|uniref:Uncharacterized protein n=1 Tax=Gracilibacillus salitolerans TaxID=2663022 RepID=A0A5Q2TPG6_9BACI|nr:hypothetical protein [Gracilibacillus salitolerans]QGH36696.1 hypothetical protein GI584_22725 [Gracilibacillus salitolerans]
MGYFFSFVLSVVLTTLSYFLGSQLIMNDIAIWQSVVIGFSVVSLGALTESLGAPIWLIVLVPIPIGMLLLYLFLNKPLHIWLLTYITVLALYTVIHVIMSYFFRFHSLIPAWRLS